MIIDYFEQSHYTFNVRYMALIFILHWILQNQAIAFNVAQYKAYILLYQIFSYALKRLIGNSPIRITEEFFAAN